MRAPACTITLALALGGLPPAQAQFSDHQMDKVKGLARTCAAMEASLPRYGYPVEWLPTFLRRARALGATQRQLHEIRKEWHRNAEPVRYSDEQAITDERVDSTTRTCTLHGPSIPR
jgi:hypothetical protein